MSSLISTDSEPPASDQAVVSTHFSDPADGFGPSMNALAPQFVKLQVVSNLIASIIVCGVLLGALLILGLTSGVGWGLFLALAGCSLILGILCFFCFAWPKLVFQNYRWRLTEDCLEIHRGVFWKHRIVVPLGRLQHADVTQGPLLRHFGLGVLIVHTAGTSNATIELHGLTHDLALALRDRLVQQTQKRATIV